MAREHTGTAAAILSPSRQRVVDVELSEEVTDIQGLEGYAAVLAVVRLHGTPIGTLRVPIVNGSCRAATLLHVAQEKLGSEVVGHLLADALAQPHPVGALVPERLASVPHEPGPTSWPSVTVAVCTRDRPSDLALCLESLRHLDYPGDLELLVVDNAPGTDQARDVVHGSFPSVRYVREDRPGLDWARNRALVEARAEILAYTDDDAVVDRGWLRALTLPFAESPGVGAVTGLVVPFELETDAQALFERYSGFGRGFERRRLWVDVKGGELVGSRHGGTGAFGTGANMAFRRPMLLDLGGFDPALDVGTTTKGGGDLEMFFRVLKAGHILAYEPAAVVRHRHRRDYGELRTQIEGNGSGLYAYLTRSALAFPEERRPLARLGAWWFCRWDVRRLLVSLARPALMPRDLIVAELAGSVLGPVRYRRAREEVRRIERTVGAMEGLPVAGQPVATPTGGTGGRKQAVRSIDLNRAVTGVRGLSGYSSVRAYVIAGGRALGLAQVPVSDGGVDGAILRQAIVDAVGTSLLDPHTGTVASPGSLLLSTVFRGLARGDLTEPVTAKLPTEVSVSVVVATRDRPDDLRACLRSLQAQSPVRPTEIVVVDNHPESGLTPPVVAEFPGVRLLSETRRGLAYARNCGISAAAGSILATTDDDVVVPPGWLENLLAPFSEADVMVVTGNVLPLELETDAQRLFELYGGLGRGFQRTRFDSSWSEGMLYRAVPTWELGATANAAFRREIFGHPGIGLLDEVLGPGTPTGVGEDTYLFYKVLKAGYAIVYEPAAFVWHRHRREISDLRRQLYDYSRGHVGYHLTTLIQDGDLRALIRLGKHLPVWRVRQLVRALLKRTPYPAYLSLLEAKGNLAGPLGLHRSRRRVRRKGRSQP